MILVIWVDGKMFGWIYRWVNKQVGGKSRWGEGKEMGGGRSGWKGGGNSAWWRWEWDMIYVGKIGREKGRSWKKWKGRSVL